MRIAAGVVPAAGTTDELVRLGRTPRPRRVLIRPRVESQCRIDDRPGGFHLVLPREMRRIANERFTDEPRVGIHLVGLLL